MKLWDEYKDRPFVLMALTDEAAGEVERKVMDVQKPTYPIGVGVNYDRSYAVSGLPTAVLIDANGVILWRDNFFHEAMGLLEEALVEVERFGAQWDPGQRHADLGRAVDAARKGEMGKAWKESQAARARAVENPELLAAVEGFEKDFLERAGWRTARKDEMLLTGRYYEATAFLEQEMKVFAGSPPADDWKAAVAEWRKDKTAKANMDLDKKRLAAVEKGMTDRDKGLKDLRALRDKAEGLLVEQAIDASYKKLAGL